MKYLSITIITCFMCLIIGPTVAYPLQLGSYEEILGNDESAPPPPAAHGQYKKGEVKEDNFLNEKPELIDGVKSVPAQRAGSSATGEAERARRFDQDQTAKENDFRRAFPNEPVPPRDAYKTYNSSPPPQKR